MSPIKRIQIQKRPFCVTLLVIGVICFIVLHIVRVISAIGQWRFLNTLLGNVIPVYIFFTGLCWSIAGSITAYGLWSGKRWAKRFTIIAALVFTLLYWVDQLLIMANQIRSTNWPFLVLVNLIILILLIWLLNCKAVKTYLGVNNESEPQDRGAAQ